MIYICIYIYIYVCVCVTLNFEDSSASKASVTLAVTAQIGVRPGSGMALAGARLTARLSADSTTAGSTRWIKVEKTIDAPAQFQCGKPG